MKKENKNIYFISGLGANSKVFEKLKLDNYIIHNLEWIEPEENETITSYAKRMSLPIDKEKEIYLIGLSFGGIIAQEIADQLNCKKTVIISSVKQRKELPFIYRFSSVFKLHKLIPTTLFKNSKHLAKIIFGKNNKFYIDLLDKYFTHRNDKYINWSIDKVVSWKGVAHKGNLLHLHGEKDLIFPLKNIKNVSVIKNGSHFMVFNRSAELSDKIINFLEDNNAY